MPQAERRRAARGDPRPGARARRGGVGRGAARRPRRAPGAPQARSVIGMTVAARRARAPVVTRRRSSSVGTVPTTDPAEVGPRSSRARASRRTRWRATTPLERPARAARGASRARARARRRDRGHDRRGDGQAARSRRFASELFPALDTLVWLATQAPRAARARARALRPAAPRSTSARRCSTSRSASSRDRAVELPVRDPVHAGRRRGRRRQRASCSSRPS